MPPTLASYLYCRRSNSNNSNNYSYIETQQEFKSCLHRRSECLWELAKAGVKVAHWTLQVISCALYKRLSDKEYRQNKMSLLMDDAQSSAANDNDLPPGLREMFINSIDTLQKRQISQRIPDEWSDRPPLFYIRVQQRRRFWQGPKEEQITEQEDPNLLKGVRKQGNKMLVFKSERRILMHIPHFHIFVVRTTHTDDPKRHSTPVKMRRLVIECHSGDVSPPGSQNFPRVSDSGEGASPGPCLCLHLG